MVDEVADRVLLTDEVDTGNEVYQGMESQC